MGFSSFDQQNKLRTMDDNHHYDTEEEEDDDEGFDSFSLDSSCDEDSDQDQQVNSQKVDENGALGDMSSLLQQLPIKRGLSKHFQGKSQSFTSLASVLCVEDLAKPENPYNMKMKSCRSYGGLLLLSSENKNRKKGSSSKGSCSSLMNGGRNNMSFLGHNNRAPPPHRSTSTNNFSSHTSLVA